MQGSGIRPWLLIIFIAELRAGDESNTIVKYTVDASLLALEKTDMHIKYEFDKVAACFSNKFGINMAKLKEIVVHRPQQKNILLPTTLRGIERVLSAKLLVVWLQSDLGMGIDVNNSSKYVSDCIYKLKCKKTRPVSNHLNVAFEAIVISRIIFVESAWIGSASRADIDLIQKAFVKTKRASHCKYRLQSRRIP